MNNPVISRALASAFALSLPTLALAQGPLIPPGPPAALFKTLEQIEPRTDLRQVPGSASIGHIISRPGSYYLSTNLVFTNQSGIRIIADNVTLDLNGFLLQGVSNRTAILGTNGLERVRIRNGILSGWDSGVDFYTSGQSTNVVLEDLAVVTAPGATIGIITGPETRVTRCSVSGVLAGSGFAINVGNRSAVESCEVVNSYGGITVGLQSSVRDCAIADCGGNDAIFADDSSLVQHNRVDRCLEGGIRVNDHCLVLENICTRIRSGHGIYLSGSHSRVDGNVMNFNSGNGIQTAPGTSNNVVVRNLARGNTNGNYNFLGSAARGPTVTTTGVITNHPWANFSY